MNINNVMNFVIDAATEEASFGAKGIINSFRELAFESQFWDHVDIKDFINPLGFYYGGFARRIICAHDGSEIPEYVR